MVTGSPIDQALTFAEAGEHEKALRYSGALLEAEPRAALRVLLPLTVTARAADRRTPT